MLRKQIVDHWNRAGLTSVDSSTCSADPNIASCDNFIESKFLENIVLDFKYENEYTGEVIGIDIGAGLGRFTFILARNLTLVHALEPAEKLYYKLKENCSEFENVRIFNTEFESFSITNKYDVGVVSGVLYLYSHEMVQEVMNKLVNNMNANGIIVIRDFIIKDAMKQVSSSYIKGGFCYYRDSKYWKNLAQEYNMVLYSIFESRPSYPFNKFMHLCTYLGLTRVFRLNILKQKQYDGMNRKKGHLKFSESEIKTVFIVMGKNEV